ncbi:MAG: 50S ribosome-binding GTPase [Planctomycetes bacterium]|nr:50S ribosome-binding GTPase [Planctomycetota bacterium]
MDSSSTILAVASPPGCSARGIVRISGDQTFDLLAEHVEPDVRSQHGALLCRLRLRAHDLPVLILSFRAPHSYTGEDAAELQMPGNPILLERVIDELLATAQANGIDARRAEAGQFTARAYFHGKMTLTQAEGVASVIAAQSDAELRAARLLAAGKLGLFAHALADELASALALVEAGLDFTDQEDVVPITPQDLHDRLISLDHQIEAQLDRAIGMERLEAIPWVVLIGEPNAGKSTLFNALLGTQRAVVSQIPGTTRDVLTEPLQIETDHGPAEVMLVDLAGAADAVDQLDELMQASARSAIDRAELILRCVPTDQPLAASRAVNAAEIVLRTKADLTSAKPSASGLFLSAETGEGLDELRRIIAQRLSDHAVSLAADALALRPRHEAALRAAHSHLTTARQSLAEKGDGSLFPHGLLQPELTAASMRLALNELSRLAGDITPDDVLGRIFSTFCVGK